MVKNITFSVSGKTESTVKTFTASAFYFLAAACMAFAALVMPVTAGEQTAQVILERSAKAMAPPIQYTMDSSGVSVLISQKEMSDGSSVTRTDTKLPIRKFSRRLGNDTFEVYPDYGVLMDLGFMHEHLKNVKEQTLHALTALGDFNKGDATVLGSVVHDGKDCFEIESVVASELQQFFSKMMPPEASRSQQHDASTTALPDRKGHI